MMTNLSISARKLVLKSDDWLLGYFKAVTCCHCEESVSLSEVEDKDDEAIFGTSGEIAFRQIYPPMAEADRLLVNAGLAMIFGNISSSFFSLNLKISFTFFSMSKEFIDLLIGSKGSA